MALTDPELDLLRELLQDDPTDDVFLQVGAELVRRQAWAEAERVLRAGLEAHPDEREGWELLARAAMECGHHDAALTALPHFDTDPARAPEHARLEIEILERAGLRGDAAGRIDVYLAVHPDDAEVRAVRDRLAGPPTITRKRGADPFDNPERAERYVAIGRVDRALRVYRRLLYHHPDDARFSSRLQELVAQRPAARVPDLAEELGDPRLAPSRLPDAPQRPTVPWPVELEADEEDTDPDAHDRPRRRRTLLQR